jgi:hypothetical protein
MNLKFPKQVMNAIRCSVFITAALASVTGQDIPKQYAVPLAMVIPFFNSATGELDEVLIKYGRDNIGWTISDGDDRYIKDTERMSREHTHRELMHVATYLSPFEAEQINKVCHSFVRTLNILERDLETDRWDRCLYLDNTLAFFLRGFYYLLSAARRSRTYLPVETCIKESMFDSPADSTRSRKRIHDLRNDTERVIKLRISIRELVFQLEQWQKKELDNPARDMWTDNSGNFVQAYVLFIHYYFNILPLPEIKKRK